MANKVLITTSTYPRWEGDSTTMFVKDLAEHVVTSGWATEVLAPHYKGAKQRETVNGVNVTRFRYFWPYSQEDIVYEGGGVNKVSKSPMYALKLGLLFLSLTWSTFIRSTRSKSTVINPHWIIPQGFAAVIVKLITGKRVVLTVHGSDINELTGGFFTLLKKFTLKHSDEVCVNSTDTLERCLEVCRREYTLIPMGLNEAFIESGSTKTKHKDDSSTTSLLFVGRLAEVKGVTYLLDGLRKLSDEGVNFKATIVGDGPQREMLEDKARDYGLETVVHFAGWVVPQKLGAYYESHDVFVGPSLKDAQGIVFVEALAKGLPVIASNVGGIPDVVDSTNGILVEPKNADQLASAIKTITDPSSLNTLHRNISNMDLGRYAWPHISEKYVAVYDSATKGA